MSATTQSVKDKLAAANNVSKLPARQAGGTALKSYFDANKGAMMQVLPKHINGDRMLNIALSAMRKTPALMECTIQSLMGAVVACSQLGLEPNTPLGLAYLVPFNTKDKKTGKFIKDVQVIPGYRGLIDLARRSGQIESISAHAVHEYDEFEFCYGLEEKLVHKPDMLRADRGEILCFYAVAKLKGGGHVFEVMSKLQVDDIRDNSEGYKSSKKYNSLDRNPWHTHYEEMGRKTVIRRLSKYLPMSIELATAIAMDELADRGASQHLDDALAGEYTVDAPDDETVPQEPEQSTESQQPPFDEDVPPFDQSTGEIQPSETDILKQIEQAPNVDAVDLAVDLARNANLKPSAFKRVTEAAAKRKEAFG